MKALVRIVDVVGEPIRWRITPQPQSPDDYRAIKELCGTKGYFDMETTPNSLLVVNADLGDVLVRVFRA